MNPDILDGFAQASMMSSLIATGIGSLLGLVVGMIPGMTISTPSGRPISPVMSDVRM